MPESAPQPAVSRQDRRHSEAPAGENLPTDRPWLIGEAGAFLRVDARTVRRLIARGTLPACRVPGTRKILIDPEAVRQLVASSTTGLR
ncbi:MAG: helix-turn-helix domain-containing protein [Acidimicrobiales bacterium]|jgi:excisionase family DNA binding protein